MRDSILFDGEGVVIDSEPIWDRGQEEFLRRRNIVYDREKLKPLLAGRSMEEGVRLLQSLYGFGGSPEILAKERIAIVKDLFAHATEFVPGFMSFYHRLPASFKTCIATMMPEDLLDVVINRLDLRRLFGTRIFSPRSHAMRGKPAPDLFLYAAEQLHSLPQQCIVIEDSPNGIEAANRAGIFCIGIATTFAPSRLTKANRVVSSFEEIDLSQLDS
jgi:beta-phosphoglucomutase-like phosphatase (HAD superfamily)